MAASIEQTKKRAPMVSRGSVITLLTILAVLIVLASRIPNLDEHRRQIGNEIMAMLQLQHFEKALLLYQIRCGGYPTDLRVLIEDPKSKRRDCRHSGVYEEILKSEQYSEERIASNIEFIEKGSMLTHKDHYYFGYIIQYHVSDSAPPSIPGVELNKQYYFTADPDERGHTGFASFFMTQDGRLHHHDHRPANANDPIIPFHKDGSPTAPLNPSDELGPSQ